MRGPKKRRGKVKSASDLFIPPFMLTEVEMPTSANIPIYRGRKTSPDKSPKNYDTWHLVPVDKFGIYEIACWVKYAFSKESDFLIQFFRDVNITTSQKLLSLTSSQFYCFVETNFSKNNVKMDPAIPLCHFSYLKYCHERKKQFNIHFGTLFIKLIKNPIVRFKEYFQLSSMFDSKNGRKLVEMNVGVESKMKTLTLKVINKILPILNKQNTENMLMEYFAVLLKENKKLELRLIVVDQFVESDNHTLSSATKLITPLVGKVYKSKFGLWHTGLIIGNINLFVEWTISGIVMFERFNSPIPIAMFCVEPISLTKEKCVRFAKSVADFLYTWNVEKKYALFSTNCQFFVMELMKIFDVDMEKIIGTQKGSFKNFVDRVKKNGNYKKKFVPSTEFLEKYMERNSQRFDKFMGKSKKKKVTFMLDTHMKLDDFCTCLKEEAFNHHQQHHHQTSSNFFVPSFYDDVKRDPKDPTGLFSTPEWNLLKSWDDMYWYQFFNSKKDPFQFRCLKKGTEICCPFMLSSGFSKKIEENRTYERIKFDLTTGEDSDVLVWRQNNYSKYANKQGFIVENDEIEISQI